LFTSQVTKKLPQRKHTSNITLSYGAKSTSNVEPFRRVSQVRQTDAWTDIQTG